jgi:hypothetical protein
LLVVVAAVAEGLAQAVFEGLAVVALVVLLRSHQFTLPQLVRR